MEVSGMTPNPHLTLADALLAKGQWRLSDSIILIGSRASGCSRPDSDWDIIQVTSEVQTIEHDVRKTAVQFIRIHPEYLHRTELGIHASSHGVGISARVPRRDELDIPNATAALRRRIERKTATMVGWVEVEKKQAPTSVSNRVLMDCIRLRHALDGRLPPNRFIQEEAKVTTGSQEEEFLEEYGRISIQMARKIVRGGSNRGPSTPCPLPRVL